MRRVSARWGAAVLVCLAGATSAQGADTPPQLVLGVVPQFPAVELQRRWAPVVGWLESACKLRIRLDFAAGIPEFEARFLDGRHDLAYLNPYHAVMARRAQGYEPLVRDGQAMLKGVLTVRTDSPVQRLQDLQGATIAFPSPNAFGASLYMRALLERQHRVRFTPFYAKTHGNAYRHVIKGEALAAGGVGSTLAAETPDVQSQLRVLYETPPTAPHPLAAHPRVGAEQRRCITEQLTAADLPQATRDWLGAIQMPQPVPAVYARDYQPLEKLALESYVVHSAP
jgi:phosphonate transport system substrate-binding protein